MSPGGKRQTGRTKNEYGPAETNRDNRYYVSARVGERVFKALVDPGAANSYLSAGTAEFCQSKGWSQRKENKIAAMADGTPANLRISLKGQLAVLGREIEHSFLVMDKLTHDILLGMDTLNKLEIRIILAGKELRQKGTRNQSEVNTVDKIGLSKLTEEENRRLENYLSSVKKEFMKVKGVTPLATHEIKLIDDTPIKQRYRPRNPAMQELINQEVDKMLADKVIQRSDSPWSSPIVIAPKKGGKHRFCVDFRRLNKVSQKDAYPLPQINATLDKLKGARYLSTIDLKNGYWQVALTRDSRPLTAFTVPGRGLFEFKVLPFGLHAAPATFQRLLDRVITPEMAPHAFAYLDDIIIVSETFDEHMQILEKVCNRLKEAKLVPNWEKCQFAREELKYLGHIVNKNGLQTDPEKISAISKLAPPTNVKELRQFFGLISWYRRFVKDAAQLANPLNRLTKKKATWEWGEIEQKAFDELKKRLTQAPTLACPDWSKTFILQTDASLEGLGAVLTQSDGETEQVIAYASRSLNKAEKNYSVTELECLAVKWGIWKMRGYLEGYHFIIQTDHQSLKWLDKIENPSGRLARWAMELSQWDFDIEYRKGTENNVADALSRQPLEVCETNLPTDKWYDKMYKAVTEDPENNPEYCIRDKRLYRHILHTLDFKDTDPSDEWKICVAENERKRVLKENHDIPTAGHLGVAKTNARLAARYYWPGMFREATAYVRSCDNCQKHKSQQQLPAGKMHATFVEQPGEMFSVDLVGPLPRSTNGHNFLLVMQDRFSKWVELKPLRKATGHSVAQAVMEQIILRHGCPKTIVSDNGRQFVSREFTNALKDAKIIHRRTPAYAAQCNPVERANKTIKMMMKQYIKSTQKTWDTHVPEIAFAFNTAVSESTGYTPAYLTYARELIQPGTLQQEIGRRTRSTLGNRINNHQEALELARINMARSFDRQRRHYDLRRRTWAPEIGERVLKRQHILSKKVEGINAKLAEKFEGPHYIVRKISPVIYDLQDGKGGLIRHIHIKDLKPYISPEKPGES